MLHLYAALAAPTEGGLIVWDPQEGTHRLLTGLVDAEGKSYTPRLGRFDAASGRAIAAAWANAGMLWSVDGATSPRRIGGAHAGNTIETMFLPDGRILTSGVDERLHVWNFDEPYPMAPLARVEGAPLKTIRFTARDGLVAAVVRANDRPGHRMATAGPLVVIDARTGQLVGAPLTAFDNETGVELVRPGGLLATKGADGLRLWTLRPETWQQMARSIAGRDFDESELRRFGIR